MEPAGSVGQGPGTWEVERGVGSVRLVARASHPELLQALLLELPCTEVVDATSTLRIQVEVGLPPEAAMPPLQEGAWGVRYGLAGSTLHLRTQGGTAFLVEGGTGRMEILLPPSLVSEAVTEVGAGMATALPFLLREAGLQPLHAAAVRWSREGTEGILLLPGLSGSGKSTTAGRLAAQGGRLLSDDLSLVSVEADEALRIVPYARPARFRGEALRRFPELAPVEVEVEGSRPPPPQALVFPLLDLPGITRLLPLSQTEALSRLIECSLLMGEAEVMARQLRCLGQLARLPAYVLLLGTEGPEPATLLGDLLSSAASDHPTH